MSVQVRSINSEEDAKWAIARIDELVVRDDLNFEEEEELNILSILVSSWENNFYNKELESLNDLPGMIKFMMNQHGISKQQELIPSVFANKVRASEVLNGKRVPSIEEMKKINRVLRIPFEYMIND